MTIKPFLKAIAAVAISGFMLSASANVITLQPIEYDDDNGQVSVTVSYDFSVDAMFGGGLDLIYDAGAIEFVSFTQGPLSSDAQGPASPVGELAADGEYIGFGVGTFDFFVGMTMGGDFGTFVFNVLGATDSNATPCGGTMCLRENEQNPFTQLNGNENGAAMLAAGETVGNVIAAPIPVPAAVWFMLSGLGALLGFGRKSA